jgi:Uma2 family endonuclease
VRVLLRLSRRTTYADYLAAEQNSERRHELIDGVIVVVPGGTIEHSAISARLAGLFGVRLPGGCLGYSCQQRFWIPATARGRYSDGSIICGKPEHPAHDGQATTNPLVVVEVLSPSSEGDDDGDKRRDFQSLASLQAYVLVAQDARCVKVYRRTEHGEWRDQPDVYRGGESFELPRLSRAIALDEVYDDILDADGRSLLR